MLNTINDLKGRRLAVNITFEPLAREFAPITRKAKKLFSLSP
jgi:hypothetical protein